MQKSSKTPKRTSENEKEDNLESALLNQGLNEKHVKYIMGNGERFLGHPGILAEKLSIEISQAKNALNEFKNYRNNQITKDEINKFEKLVKKNQKKSLTDIALLHDIDENVISAYLENTEISPMKDSQKQAIKEKINAGFSITEIADQLQISQMRAKDYVELKFITFRGTEGHIILETINRNFGKYPIMKLREWIINKNVKLQEQICCQLPKANEKEYTNLKQYFMKFEESQNFFEIDRNLNNESKECIRASSLDDIEELSTQLNRMELVIRDYLLQYFQDESLMLHYAQEQLKNIQKIMDTFGMDEQISHTTYRMIISDSFKTLIQDAGKTGKLPKVIMSELLPLAFYYLKCSLPLDEYSQIIANITNISLTTLDIFHILFQMSDPIVRGLCIEHYSFSNPVPFYYPRLEPYSKHDTVCEFEICKELWYSLQQFNGLVSFGLGWSSWNPIGKSHLLDLMFETDFVKGSPQNSAFHFGSIDIQMTKNLFGNKAKNIDEPTQWAYFDCHGCSDVNVIMKMCHILDVALIHVSYSDYKENFLLLEQELNTMTNSTQHVYLFVRDYTGSVIEKEEILRGEKTYSTILIPHLNKINTNWSLNLKKIGYTILHSPPGSTKSSNFFENVTIDINRRKELRKENEIIQTIINQISKKDRAEFSPLTYYPHFILYMQCFYRASNESDQKIVDEMYKKCRQLDEKLRNVKMSEIVWYFNEIIAQENSTLLLWKLAQELKICGEKYTLEILWREALLSNKYKDCTHHDEASRFAEDFSSNFSNHVKRGEPFELIDGDNLRFFNQDIDTLLSDLYENQSQINCINENNKSMKKRPPIVISIFGPQSSGKSTLLNYCFGCKFLTSAGRCTKGVYGSLSKLSQPVNHSDHFLILDTEGLDSIEKGKVLKETSCIHFDRTMVLFCLAVSQVVIINVRGEIGEEMQNILQICAYSLNKLKVSKVSAPKIFFVLNQLADPDPNKHLSSINTLLEDLKRESDLMETEDMTISELIKVSRENLFVLPSAFNSTCVNTQLAELFDSDLNKLSPTVSFANKCADLRMSIIQQLNDDDTPDNQAPFTTMSEWMEMSGVIWDTIVKYQDIVKYRNVEELKCSNLLNIILDNILKNNIYFNKKEFQKITDDLIKIIEGITSWSPPNGILEDVKKKLDETFKNYQEEALTKFAELCKGDQLLKKMNYLCDDAKLNLCRLIFMEKKIYENKLIFEIKARLTEIKISENMAKFQEDIEKNAEKYLQLNIEEQKSEFDKVWMECFDCDTNEEEKAERDEMFDNLYAVFRIESKTMESKQSIYSLFREFNFDMGNIISTLRKEIHTKFKSNVFAGNEQFLYPWKENKVPLKDMTPYTGKKKCEYLCKESLWIPFKIDRDRKTELKFQECVPPECHPLIQYCSGYYNHPDVVWNLEKRKQILLLASQLKDPNNLERSTWDKFISDIATRIAKFIEKDPNIIYISHSTVKEIVDSLCNFIRVVNYEINFIEAKLTNTAERTISTFAFALTFKSLLGIKAEKQKEKQSKINKNKALDLEYFLQKVKNRKIARLQENWDRIEMRKGDEKIAKKFAGDLLDAIWRCVNTTCERNLNENYFIDKIDTLSHKSLLLLANEKIREELNKNDQNEPITEDNFVVQFICNQTQTMKKLFQEEWLKVVCELRDRIVGNMTDQCAKQISIFQHVLIELKNGLIIQCEKTDNPEGIRLDSDFNFEMADKATTEKIATISDHRTREAPLKSMVLFLQMYLNPKVSPEELNQFFSNSFEVDGVKMTKHHEFYVLNEKPNNPTHILDKELFKKLTDTKLFSSSETIFNIKVYLEEYLTALECYEFQVTQADYENILKPTKEQFETRVINCPYQCPSCGKFCEREIHPHEGKCQIMTGHQLCSMGGKVWNTNKDRTAVLLMCEGYKDDSPVLIPGQTQNMKWWEFKEKCEDQWDWSLPDNTKYVALRKENREKMEKIWIKFGEQILQYYANKGTQIKYIPYTTPQEIYDDLFLTSFYVCFVMDGTRLTSSDMKYVRKWVSDCIEELEGKYHFKIIVYHGHCSFGSCVEKFPFNSEFTSDKQCIRNYLGNITNYSEKESQFPMLHGLATATTGSEWRTGFGIKNIIVHIYVEPGRGKFNVFNATGKCKQGCPLEWERDIKDRINQLQIEYHSYRLVPRGHPGYVIGRRRSADYKISSDKFKSQRELKLKSIFINHKPDM